MDNENNNFQQQQPQQPFQAQQPQQPQQPKKSDGLAIASMILGIVSILFTCCYGGGLITGIVGLVLGIIAKSKGQNKGFTLTGIITSAVAIFLGIIVLILIIFGVWASVADPYYWY